MKSQHSAAKSTTEAPEVPTCSYCLKPLDLCLCSEIAPLESHTRVLILRHPREPDQLLGTAAILAKALPNSVLKTGLSWPNLAKALGAQAENKRWGVLFLGTQTQTKAALSFPPGSVLELSGKTQLKPLGKGALDGIVVLDGTWSQAKAMWWRNAWLLKLRRIVLHPKSRSLYGKIRREPRGECLSTLESVAQTLTGLGEKPEVEAGLLTSFRKLLEKYQGSYR